MEFQFKFFLTLMIILGCSSAFLMGTLILPLTEKIVDRYYPAPIIVTKQPN